MAAALRNVEACNRRDFAAVTSTFTPRRLMDDRRRLLGRQVEGDLTEELMFVLGDDASFSRPELVEARGERVALARWNLHSSDYELPFLAITRVDGHGRIDEFVMFDDDDLDGARLALDDVAARARERRFENDASSEMSRVVEAFNDGDPSLMAAGAHVFVDRRSIVGGSYDRALATASQSVIVQGGGHFENETMATRGRTVALQRWWLLIPQPESEVEILIANAVDDGGRIVSAAGFDPDDEESARAELDHMYAAGEGAAHTAILEHLAADAADRDLAVLHQIRVSDGAGLRVLRPEGDGEPWIEVVTHDRAHTTGAERFHLDDVDAALLRFEELTTGPTEPFANDAWEAAHRVEDSDPERDLDGVFALFGPDYVYDDNRVSVRTHLLGDEAVGQFRWMLDLGQLRYVRELVATRGHGLALTRDTVSFVDGSSGPAEVQALTVVSCEARGARRRVRRLRSRPARRGLRGAGCPPHRDGRAGRTDRGRCVRRPRLAPDGDPLRTGVHLR